MSTLTHPPQHISGKAHDRRIRRSRKHCKQWKQKITNFPYYGIDGLARVEEELAKLVERLDNVFTACGMEISAKRTKLMTNNTSDIKKAFKVNKQRFETVTGFKYLRSVVSDEGFKPEILSSTAQTPVTLEGLKPVWNDGSISLSSRIRPMRSLVSSSILYACEPWTVTVELSRRIRAMRIRCYRKIPRISYKDHVTNQEVCARIHQAVGPYENLTIVKTRKLKWCRRVSRSSDVAKTILQSTVKGG